MPQTRHISSCSSRVRTPGSSRRRLRVLGSLRLCQLHGRRRPLKDRASGLRSHSSMLSVGEENSSSVSSLDCSRKDEAHPHPRHAPAGCVSALIQSYKTLVSAPAKNETALVVVANRRDEVPVPGWCLRANNNLPVRQYISRREVAEVELKSCRLTAAQPSGPASKRYVPLILYPCHHLRSA